MRTVILFCLQAEQGAGLFNAVKACAAVHAEVLLQHPLLCTIRLDHHKAVVLAEQVFQIILVKGAHRVHIGGVEVIPRYVLEVVAGHAAGIQKKN